MTIATWSPDALAAELMGRREEFVRELPKRIRTARHLTRDQLELVVDDSISHLVLVEHGISATREDAERVFLAAATLRVARVLEGRGETVRAGYERVDPATTLADIEADDGDPADIVERAMEHALHAEFAATLEPLEGAVLRARWHDAGSQPAGHRSVAMQLKIAPRRAKAAERSILGKLDRFAAIYAAGRLCAERTAEIAALAHGAADVEQSNRAHAHIEHCVICKRDLAAQLRAVHSATFQRKLASLAPVAPMTEGARQHGGTLRDVLADWTARLLGQEGPAVAAQAAASGVGRGTGAVLAVKLAAVLAAAGGATVGVTSGLFEGTSDRPPQQRPAAPARTAKPKPKPTRTPAPTPRPTATIRPKPKQPRRASQPQTQGGTGPRAQEQSITSPAPAGSLPNGGSEFSPDSAALPPAPPAPPPAAPGAAEFGP